MIKTSEYNPIQERILRTAFLTFARFGYAKTSLNDIANNADTSRQSIYVNYKDKKRLFCAALEYELTLNLEESTAVIQTNEPPTERLTEAFRIWHGKYQDSVPMETGFIRTANELAGEAFARLNGEFLTLITEFIGETIELHRHQRSNTSPEEIAKTLRFVSLGLKNRVSTEHEYVDGMRVAVRAIFDL